LWRKQCGCEKAQQPKKKTGVKRPHVPQHCSPKAILRRRKVKADLRNQRS
jgi:hypothetical protein